MKRLPPRSRLLVLVLLAVMLVLLAFTVATYWRFTKVIETELVDTMTARTKESAGHIDTWLAGRFGEVRETAQSPVLERVLALNPGLDLWRSDRSIALIDEINLARWRFVSATYPDQYWALHIVNPLAPGEWGDPAKLPLLTARYFNVREGICKTDAWARGLAEEAGQRYSRDGGAFDAIFKPAYSQAYERDMLSMLAWRRDDKGNVVAGVGASLTIEAIQGIAQQLKHGRKGYGILLAQDGTFVTHPNPAWSMKQKAATVGDDNMRRLGELAAGGETGTFRFTEGRDRKIAFYSPIPVAGWAVVSVVDEAELFVPAATLLTLLQIIIAVIVVSTLLAAAIMAYIIHLRRSYAADRRAYLAEIAALQAQIQPHFLYNTLNTVAALCRIEPAKAAELLDELSDYLQGKFRLNAMEMVPLSQELDLVKSYLAIVQARFGERLKFVLSVEPGADPLIPPLILQPLVENAVKHGVYPKRAGGTIRITVKKVSAATVIVVADDGVGIAPDKLAALRRDEKGQAVGIGLQNIDKRLKKHYGAGLDIRSLPGKGTAVVVTIPDERGERYDKYRFN
jgi:two-component sensor histidine kinase